MRWGKKDFGTVRVLPEETLHGERVPHAEVKCKGEFMDWDGGDGLRVGCFPLDSKGLLVYSGSNVTGWCGCGRLSVP